MLLQRLPRYNILLGMAIIGEKNMSPEFEDVLDLWRKTLFIKQYLFFYRASFESIGPRRGYAGREGGGGERSWKYIGSE